MLCPKHDTLFSELFHEEINIIVPTIYHYCQSCIKLQVLCQISDNVTALLEHFEHHTKSVDISYIAPLSIHLPAGGDVLWLVLAAGSGSPSPNDKKTYDINMYSYKIHLFS